MAKQPYEVLGAFPTTHWTLVARAGGGTDAAWRSSLEQLLQKYMPALRHHLRVHRRIPADRAEDFLQGFLSSKILEQGIIQRAQKEKGRFRNFLCVALDHFVSSEKRRENAKMRKADSVVSISEEMDTARTAPSASAGFDVAWARQLLAEALKRMESSCRETGRADVWGVFVGRILGPTFEQAEEESYESLVQKFGFTSPAQASNVLMTAKRMFIRVLRALIGEYEKEPDDIDAEIADLWQILSTSANQQADDRSEME